MLGPSQPFIEGYAKTFDTTSTWDLGFVHKDIRAKGKLRVNVVWIDLEWFILNLQLVYQPFMKVRWHWRFCVAKVGSEWMDKMPYHSRNQQPVYWVMLVGQRHKYCKGWGKGYLGECRQILMKIKKCIDY